LIFAVGLAARMGESIGVCRVLVGENLRERVHLENLGIDGSIMLKCVLKKSVGRSRT
jgi:hypothetical protein